jgi:hypothetical protein
LESALASKAFKINLFIIIFIFISKKGIAEYTFIICGKQSQKPSK